MNRQKVTLLLINVIGGIAVIGSYIYGLNAHSAGAAVLWGGVPQSIQPVYAVSMIISAIGYFTFLYHLLVKLNPIEVVISGKFNYSLFYWIFIAILLPSAFWMPLTNLYVTNPVVIYWILIRAVLFIVGFASLALVWAIYNTSPKTQGIPRLAAIAGSIYFTFHTLILDAIIWAQLF
ncbi:MAG: hypothetical protein PHF74_01430 [Dehalococcoidales bacterium]|nr:hypothetical protein [Dehalococcoidales bacterium]